MNKRIFIKPGIILAAVLLLAGCSHKQASQPQTQTTTSGQSAQQSGSNTAASQQQLDNAKQLSQQAQEYTNLSSAEQSQLQQGRTELSNNQGQQAYQTLSALIEKLKSAKTTYTVESGDNLWDISKKTSIYSEAYEWPLIYAYNSRSINDPDRIFPNQQFEIWLNPLRSEASSAIQYAKTRGPWKNGQALAADRAWLDKVKAILSHAVPN